MRVISESLSSMPRSGIRMIMELAFKRDKAFHLEVGDPGFKTPLHIQEAAIRAIRDGYTHYTMHAGIPSLREAILRKVQIENGIEAKYEQVAVTSGGYFAVAAALMATTRAGDEVLIPDPGWPTYYTQALIIGLRPVHYRLTSKLKFQPSLEEIERHITPRTRCLIINSPANPTGVVISRNTIKELLSLCEKHDIYLISDEVYEKIIFEGEHFSPASLDPDGRVIAIYSVSKTYAMTGWRIGYFVAPTAVARTMGRAIEAYLSCPSSISQKAAEAALTGSQDCIGHMVRVYAERKDVCVSALEKAGLEFIRPQGAFYSMISIDRTALGSYDFSTRLLDNTGVAVAPGLTFGPNSDKAVRISFCAETVDVSEGMSRFCDFYGELTKPRTSKDQK